jgi:hypothetical protein
MAVKVSAYSMQSSIEPGLELHFAEPAIVYLFYKKENARINKMKSLK